MHRKHFCGQYYEVKQLLVWVLQVCEKTERK